MGQLPAFLYHDYTINDGFLLSYLYKASFCKTCYFLPVSREFIHKATSMGSSIGTGFISLLDFNIPHYSFLALVIASSGVSPWVIQPGRESTSEYSRLLRFPNKDSIFDFQFSPPQPCWITYPQYYTFFPPRLKGRSGKQRN